MLDNIHDQPGWGGDASNNLKYLMAQTYGLLGFETGKAEYNKKSIAICDELLATYQHHPRNLNWLDSSIGRAAAKIALARVSAKKEALVLLHEAISDLRLDLGSLDSVITQQTKETPPPPHAFNADRFKAAKKSLILIDLSHGLADLGAINSDRLILREAATVSQEAARQSAQAGFLISFVLMRDNEAKVLVGLASEEFETDDFALAMNDLSAAVKIFRSELVACKERCPADFANQFNLSLGHALGSLGQHEQGDRATEHLKEAVQVIWRYFLFEQRIGRLDWQTYADYADVLQLSAINNPTSEGTSELNEAVNFYRFALNPFVTANKPVKWFEEQNNMAIALRAVAERKRDGPPILCEATFRSIAAERGLATKGGDLIAIQTNAAHSMSELKSFYGDTAAHQCLAAIHETLGDSVSAGR
jgi:hypothetical protein